MLILLSGFLGSKAQVNLQTGSAVFSLPMFNWQDDKSRLTSVVALSYNSGNGLRVNDVASNVGQGWNMVAGGVITRIQVGEPDDQPAYGSTSDQDITKYPAGSLYSGQYAVNGCPDMLTKYPTYGSRNTLYANHNDIAADRQLDYFSFQFNGKSGMFLLDTVGGDHGVPIGDTKLKITFTRDNTMAASYGIRTTITSFTIQDVDGVIYKFAKHGLTKLLKNIFCDGTGTRSLTQPKIQNAHYYFQKGFDQGPSASPWVNSYMAYPYIIGSWYLTEIDDPLVSTRKITLNYSSSTLMDNLMGADLSYNWSLNQYVIISYKRSVTLTPHLASINYPDSHLVVFNYAPTARYDLNGDTAMISVNISFRGRYLSKYLLNTTYLILNRYGNPTSATQSLARLCLKSVKKIGVDLKEDSPPYNFDYYKGSSVADDIVPPPFCYSKDIWGFYNGYNSLKSTSPISGTPVPVPLNQKYYNLDFYSLKGLCFFNDNVTGIYLNAKPNYAQNGLLKQIIYPTGGSLTYTYAQNTGSFINSTTVNTMGGVHVSQTSSSDGGYSNPCGTPIVTQYNYVVNGTGSASSLWGLEAPVNSMMSNNNYKDERQTIHYSFPASFSCKWHYLYPGILSQNEVISLSDLQQAMVTLAPVFAIMTLITDITDIMNVCSATAGPLEVIAVIIDVITSVIDLFFTCPQTIKYTPATIYYNYDLNGGSPLPAQFKRVEITESPGTIGKTVQQFTHGDTNNDTPDYTLWSIGANSALSAKQRYAPWAYGLPKLTTVYDVNGNKIKETQNVYDFTYAQEQISDPVGGGCVSHIYTPLTSCKCLVVNSYSERSDSWTTQTPVYITTPGIPGGASDMLVDIYNYYSGRVQLKTTYERVYRVTDATQYVQTETDYYYNQPSCNLGNYDVKQIVTTQSNGDVNYKNIKYSADYNSGVLATMVSNNMSSVPVATSNYVVKASGATQYLSEKVTEFSQLTNGDIRPYRILEQRFASPVSSLTPYSGPVTTNYSLYKIPQLFTYDANSNLIGLKDEGSRLVSNIYDYYDKYIAASVINADPVADKPAYTSFETSGLGGWTLSSGTASFNTTTYITGTRGFNLSGNTLTAPLNTAKAYIVSFWANAAGVTVTGGATLAKSGPTYLGMTYYEYNIAQGTSSVSITGSPVIDELRLFPSNSRMRTTTYDPLIGKTAECDENNRIIYYVYDNLGRLRFTQDENQNIVKMYEYNNVSAAKQTGCPTNFSNSLVSELYTRNNCTSGYQGDTVRYTIAAGTYNSTLSQLDADIQADVNVLTNGQSYANTNGACRLIYYNTAHSETDTTQTCAAGYKGGLVTYTVPARTYSTTYSQDSADLMAMNDIYANARAYANNPANAVCVVDTAADWEWEQGDSSYCQSVGGALPPHEFKKFTNVNPSSASYNQTTWQDYGPSSACPSGNYYNVVQSQAFTRNNCGTGYAGSSVTYTVAPGTYSSTTSQAAANQLATTDIANNGQAYANAHGTCTATTAITATNYPAVSGFTVTYTNVSTSAQTVFTIPSGGGVIGTLPIGTYNITIAKSGNTTQYIFGVCTTSHAAATSATFSNIAISGTCNTVTIDTTN